jgi:uncharacterized protein YyaL (SSP411 family)
MYTNALIDEKSPYLRQHAHNPVHWLPWGETAFQKARQEDKPIFLSIGYSTCHWCHVMAHESFEDPAVAEVLNRDFVPVKLDREERPDVDRIYMLFVQASTGSGGWPMSVWLTPDLKPFFGGTYFPPTSRFGRPGFRELLEHLGSAWKTERERVLSSSENVVDQLRSITQSANAGLEPDSALFESAFGPLRRSFDARWGGFGPAPKFPRPSVFNYLLRYYARTNNEEALEMTAKTLSAMSAGGIHDHLGGGFHRYSVDERWFVPHFEKMLYDQAQLAVAYAEAYQITRDEHFAASARGIVFYLRRDMTDAGGAFYSAEDADSPDPDDPSHSGEGAFYIWRKDEIDRLLGRDSGLFCARYGVQDEGNVEHDPQGEFAGRNILYEALSEAGAAARAGIAIDEAKSVLKGARNTLFEVRAQRPRPHLDRKILTSWNGLAISALARVASVLNEKEYLEAAIRAALFLLDRVYDPGAHGLLRRFCDGEAAVPAFLDDYALFAAALLDLFEAAFEPEYLRMACALARHMRELFEDRESGGFFSSRENSSDLVLRIKDDYDGAEPSGNSVATDLLLRLAQITGDDTFRSAAERSLRAFAPKIKAQPLIAPQMLVALGRSLSEPEQIIIRCSEIGTEVEQILHERRARFAPNTLVLAITDDSAAQLLPLAPFLGALERKGRITIYECRNFTCELPKILD